MCVRARDRDREKDTHMGGEKERVMFGSIVGLWTVKFLIPVHAGSVKLGLPFVVWASSWTNLHHHHSYPLVCIGCLIPLVLCMLQYFSHCYFLKSSLIM